MSEPYRTLGCRHRVSAFSVNTVVLASLLLLFGGREAAGAVPRLLRAGTRPWVAKFGIGPAIRLDDIQTHFKMSQEIGYHLMGRGTGPALGFVLGESFGEDGVVFQVGPSFWWDIQPVRGLAFFLAPRFQVGYALYGLDRGPQRDATYHFFDMQMAFELSLVLDNRGVLFFRPFSMNMFVGDFFGARYDLVFGGGVTF